MLKSSHITVILVYKIVLLQNIIYLQGMEMLYYRIAVCFYNKCKLKSMGFRMI